MNTQKGRKTYLVLSVIAMAVLMAGAAFLSSPYAAGSTFGLSGAKSMQDETDNADANDGQATSDGDGETNDDNVDVQSMDAGATQADHPNDGEATSDGDGETNDDNNS